MNVMKEALSRVVAKGDLSEAEIRDVMKVIMEGKATDAQIGALLTALRMKGETVEEITGAARVMREKALSIPVNIAGNEYLVDTCGTGGDGTGTFNISTTVAFVVAGAGIKVAKHGNRSISSKSGSADVLEALGIKIDLTPEQCGKAVETIGIGFLFAPCLHPAMKYAIGPRRELGFRTIFNVLGPLTNPAGANVQLMGVYDRSLTGPLAKVLGNLGSKMAWVVHGANGMDELSLTGATTVAQWDGECVTNFEIHPEEAGLAACPPDDLKGGDAEENGKILESILKGEKGPKRDVVLLNAGAVLYLAQKADTLEEGVRKAAETIDSGKALEKLNALKAYSNSLT